MEVHDQKLRLKMSTGHEPQDLYNWPVLLTYVENLVKCIQAACTQPLTPGIKNWLIDARKICQI